MAGQHVHRIRADDAHVGQTGLLDAQQKTADTRRVDLDAHEIPLRMLRGQPQQRVAHAKADFERAWCLPAKRLIQIDRSARQVQAVAWPQAFERLALARRHAPGAHHEAANGASVASIQRAGDRRLSQK